MRAAAVGAAVARQVLAVQAAVAAAVTVRDAVWEQQILVEAAAVVALPLRVADLAS
jgi:hypothetical protein